MRHQHSHLLASLSNVLGRESARLELRWMMQALAAKPQGQREEEALSAMVARRTSGEPLQYILGERVRVCASVAI